MNKQDDAIEEIVRLATVGKVYEMSKAGDKVHEFVQGIEEVLDLCVVAGIIESQPNLEGTK